MAGAAGHGAGIDVAGGLWSALAGWLKLRFGPTS